MYFTGNLKIDPTEATIIEEIEPKGIFKKLINRFNGSNTGKKEIETFTSVSIIKQLYKVLNTLNITNVLKLSHDDRVVFDEGSDNKNDLDTVVVRYELETDGILSESFKTLAITLEHELDDIRYIIKITVIREHEVGKYPIEINVKGLNVVDDIGPQEVESEIKRRGDLFIRFLNELDFQFRRIVEVDDIKIEHDVNLVINPRDVEIMKTRKVKSDSGNPDINIGELLKSVGMDIDTSKLFDSGSFNEVLGEGWNVEKVGSTTVKKTFVSYSSKKIVLSDLSSEDLKRFGLDKEISIPISYKKIIK